MKQVLFGLAIIVLLLFQACKQAPKLVLGNPLAAERIDETLIFSRADVEKITGPISENMAPVVKKTDILVSSQVDDMNGDGKWDELVFTLDFQASEKITLNIELVPVSEYPEFEKRTNVRLGLKKDGDTWTEVDQAIAPVGLAGFPTSSQGEGVNWENDKFGFRVYFDCRNAKDLFGKLQPVLIADKVHTPEMGSYHELADWGMDVLHCGSSLGAGGLAMLENDSLYRLGSTEVYEYQKIVEGPVRSVFELKYKGWDVAGQKLAAVEHISIFPGKYWFQSDVTASGFEGEKQLVTGIVTSRLKNEPYQFDANANYQAIATLDSQSLNNDELGMAVLLKKDEVTKIARTSNINFYKLGYQTVPEKSFSHVISETYYVAQKIKNDVPARHYFYAVWGLENQKWKDIESLKKYMGEEADKLSNPIIVAK
ncbi:MAG: hypothetical protein A2W90_02700 [Bacteroidetes bacterium GWF2_42_66]|nr:MAG: hypothetical protein A2W92_19740 [Bacteroidetes bacterium GWA2_42_15]OFY01259.1 MAG: hypothetical protein A2W89_16185 [Bacteroidetes bacterium GWE2_42_39]OFY42102.1 MAG: hypothetical protein A2W90_02700 [Bacteroidetes bacterium GWF2_42_66]HBL77695.1 hypothetical protein [Prolixibacteraceae bacterium]HCB62824.1 hypothetical protein [Bacteroidales bacterium]